MKIGYPCMNRTLGCTSARTFRLASYSKQRLIETVSENLGCLFRILHFNLTHNLLFFRITSDLVPFASHPVCRFKWQDFFKKEFNKIGQFIIKHDIRISMHPDQFTLINSKDTGVAKRSIKELLYHAQVLDLLGLKRDAKIQIHTGGAYGDKKESIKRFIRRYTKLDSRIRRRLVIENDDISYSLQDCLSIYEACGVPVLFDAFHHALRNSGEPTNFAIAHASKTWKKRDGVLMVDYSSQQGGGRRGAHAEHISPSDFKRFLEESKEFDFDLMLEIKDKEKSALKAFHIALNDRRVVQ